MRTAVPRRAELHEGFSNGRMIAMTYGNSSSITGIYFGYDSMGHVNVQKQVTGSNTYSLA